MKKTLLALAFLTLAAALPALAQDSTCNSGQLQGTAESALNTCIAQARQSFDISFEVTCGCPTGTNTVSVFGAPRCHPGEFCPLFLVLVGNVEVDCQGNVISATCGAGSPG
jgi:hypothetical protein